MSDSSRENDGPSASETSIGNAPSASHSHTTGSLKRPPSWLRHLRQSLAGVGNPAAIAGVAMLILGAVAMDLESYPLIPLAIIGVLCLLSWEHRWAQVLWYATLTAYALWLIFVSASIWFPFFLALVFAYVVSPMVDWGARRLGSRLAATTVLFLLLGAGIVLFMVLLTGQVVDTADQIGENVNPETIQGAIEELAGEIQGTVGEGLFDADAFSADLAIAIDKFLTDLGAIGAEDLSALFSGAGETFEIAGVVMINVLLFLAAAFFLLIQWPSMEHHLASWFSPERGKRLSDLAEQIVRILRHYFQGYLLLCAVVALVFFALMSAFGHPYALVLSLLIGVIGIVPYIGPLVGFVVAILLTLTLGPEVNIGFYLLATLISFGVSRILGDFILQPIVLGRVVHVNPVIALLVLFVVGNFFGVLAMLFAVPLVAIARVFLRFLDEENLSGFGWLVWLRPYEDRAEESAKRAESQRRTRLADTDSAANR